MTFKIKNCLICNKEFTPTSGIQKFCGEKCYTINRNKRAKINYWKSLNRYRQMKRRWNNSPHGKEYRKKYYLEHKDQVYKSLEKYKKASIARVSGARKLKRTGIDWICSNCHDPNKKACVHHKDENPFNNSLNNLTLLCRDCHSDIHHELNLARSLAKL